MIHDSVVCSWCGPSLVESDIVTLKNRFADVTDNMKIAREEIFGPVQSIFKFKTLDEVIDRCNDTFYGLAAGVFTKDINKALQFAQSVQAGSMWINSYMPNTPQAPFGGFKQSGFGRECGEDGLHEYLEIKAVSIEYKQAWQQSTDIKWGYQGHL